MKKDKRTAAQRQAAIKRGKKRSDRLKKTQAEKPFRQAALRAEKKMKEQKFMETLQKLMKSKTEK